MQSLLFFQDNSLYLPPGLTVDRLEEFNSKFIESIALANSLSPLGIFILGDFNTGNIFLKSTPNMTRDAEMPDTVALLPLILNSAIH